MKVKPTNLEEYSKTYKIMFINEVDVFKQGGSESTTVNSMFGEEVLLNSCVVQVIDKNTIKITNVGKTEFLNNYKTKELLSFIKNISPSVIYSLSSSFRFLLLLLKIKNKLRIPILFHYYDNWRECGRQRLKNFILKGIEDKKVGALVISDKMKLAYEKKYKNKYHVFMALPSYANLKNIDVFKDNKYHFVYAGGLHLDRYKMLLEAQKALKNYENCVLDVYTIDYYIQTYSYMFDDNFVKFHKSIDRNDLMEVYNKAHALLYVENVSEDNYTYIKYSMSTKIPEYLYSNKPIICLAKAGTASYGFLKMNKVALFAETEEDFNKAIESVINNDEKVTECLNNVSKTYLENFEIKNKKQELLELLLKLN